MQPISMITIYYWEEKLKKDSMSWKLIKYQFEQNIYLMFLVKKMHFYWTCYKWLPLHLNQ